MSTEFAPAKVNVLGVGVSAITPKIALELIDRWVRERSRQYVCVCTVHGIMECRRSEELRRVFNSAGMVTPDGMPLVWLAHAAGRREVARVYGPDLMLAELRLSAQLGHRHFFYGGGPGVAGELAERMRRRFPNVDIVGVLEPPFAPLDVLCTPATADAINSVRPDIVWVGISTPKQDQWMARLRPLLDAPVLIGVGAAFDFHTKRVRQAPRWMQRSGLEWLFRLAMDPRRLWRRYLIYNSWFLIELARQKLGLKSYEMV